MPISLYKNRNSKWRQRTIRKEHDSDDFFIDIPLGLAYMPETKERFKLKCSNLRASVHARKCEIKLLLLLLHAGHTRALTSKIIKLPHCTPVKCFCTREISFSSVIFCRLRTQHDKLGSRARKGREQTMNRP